VIVAVGADKGALGVTTAALALGMVWPTDRVVVEADPSGGDFLFGLRASTGGRLAADRSVIELANGARVRATQPVPCYAQLTTLGVAVVPGALGPETFRGMANLWPRVAAVGAAWPGTVIADLGGVQPGHPADIGRAVSAAGSGSGARGCARRSGEQPERAGGGDGVPGA
jgi:hypothetical protein